ncbi:MAG: MBL fold metallo-hydrolase [Promethearchaeota archaeon]
MNIHSYMSTNIELVTELPSNQSTFSSKYFDVYTYHTSIHFLIAKPHMFTGGNVAVVELGEGVLLFDTFVSPDANNELHTFIHSYLQKFIQCVINSHHHLEHTLGNYSIPVSTPIIAGPITLQKMQEEAFPLMRNWKNDIESCYSDLVNHYITVEDESLAQNMREDIRLFQMMNHKHFHLRAPNIIFSDILKIPGSSFMCEVHNLGPGHSEEDIVVLIPELKIALVGDLVSANYQDSDHSWYTLHRAFDPDKLISYINWLLSYDIEIFLTGHGIAVSKSDLLEYKEKMSEGIN